jgi:hypothetical protein
MYLFIPNATRMLDTQNYSIFNGLIPEPCGSLVTQKR